MLLWRSRFAREYGVGIIEICGRYLRALGPEADRLVSRVVSVECGLEARWPVCWPSFLELMICFVLLCLLLSIAKQDEQ